MNRTVINPDEPMPLNGRFASYRNAHPQGRVIGRSTFGDLAAKHQSPAEQILRNAHNPAGDQVGRWRTIKMRNRARALCSLAEAAPSNLTVTRRDGTIVYREDRLTPISTHK
jgi:hypothetical protein